MKGIAFLAAGLLLAGLSAAHAQQKQTKAKDSPAFKQATCQCRVTSRSGADWARCMAGKGFDVQPGAGSHISC